MWKHSKFKYSTFIISIYIRFMYKHQTWKCTWHDWKRNFFPSWSEKSQIKIILQCVCETSFVSHTRLFKALIWQDKDVVMVWYTIIDTLFFMEKWWWIFFSSFLFFYSADFFMILSWGNIHLLPFSTRMRHASERVHTLFLLAKEHNLIVISSNDCFFSS